MLQQFFFIEIEDYREIRNYWNKSIHTLELVRHVYQNEYRPDIER